MNYAHNGMFFCEAPAATQPLAGEDPFPVYTHQYSTSDPPNAFQYHACLHAAPKCLVNENPNWPRACLSCQSLEATQSCGKCRARYCSAECQKRDWEWHRAECKGVHVNVVGRMHFVAKDKTSEKLDQSRPGYYLGSFSAMGLKKLKPHLNLNDKTEEKLVDYLGNKMIWPLLSFKLVAKDRDRCHACAKKSDGAIWMGRVSDYKVDRVGSNHVVILYDVYCFCGSNDCSKKIWERVITRGNSTLAEKWEKGYAVDDCYFPDDQFLI